jgi:signal transduction histidine kinase
MDKKNIEFNYDYLDDIRHGINHDVTASARRCSSFIGLMEQELEDVASEKLKEITKLLKSSLNETIHKSDAVHDLITIQLKEFEANPLDLNAIITSIIHEKQAEMDNKATVTCSDLPQINGDKVWITRLLFEIIDNSFASAKSDSPLTLEIEGREDGNKLHIQIKDNGESIQESAKETVFKLFKRTKVTGLTVARAIVEKSGGDISVEPYDDGVIVHVVLPT